MFELKTYRAELLNVANKHFEVPKHAKIFSVKNYNLEDAIRDVDNYLYKHNVIGYDEDFTDFDYNTDLTRCEVVFRDADAGQELLYKLEEI
ncbi:hypothetical protein CEY02_20500 [Bacillus pumilus]|uniref:Uncharacterized protein n=1 Tax=Bacillus pumilus TaxID=1408 RepID=A0A2A5IDT8_BACPU|nr:hypothetical protein [Bacillus pumilus]PCK15500.1 hypothetical protein CEY02_20500 [Bacillus pumilus]